MSIEQARRERIRELEGARATGGAGSPVNGIDWAEYEPGSAPPSLRLRCVLPVDPTALANRVQVGGGQTIPVAVVAVEPHPEAGADTVRVILEKTGDFSRYEVAIEPPIDGEPLDPSRDFDPRLAVYSFTFAEHCDHGDCADPESGRPAPPPSPEIDYLAKDYQGFRRVMLDRLSALIPGWTERSPLDLGVTLVEVLAYAADQLSYAQDAIATEAYLETARRRVSLRRHARLVDYAVDDGASARTFIAVELAEGEPAAILPAGTRFATPLPGDTEGDPAVDLHTLAERAAVFESVEEIELRPQWNRIELHDWGEADQCLPSGTTKLAVSGDHSALVGRVVLLEQAFDPRTGDPYGQKRSPRHPVRITTARLDQDPLVLPEKQQLTWLEWHLDDALPWALFLRRGGHQGLARALGNVVAADHGLTVQEYRVSASGNLPMPLVLRRGPVSQVSPYKSKEPAAAWLTDGPATPALRVTHVEPGSISDSDRIFQPAPRIEPSEEGDWLPVEDLLKAASDARQFVVEVESDGTAMLRFGDGEQGRPLLAEAVRLLWRQGSGAAGNVGVATLTCFCLPEGVQIKASAVYNGIAATGGRELESAAAIRRNAPQAFRIQQKRCITEEDYAAFASTLEGVQRAVASLVWNGSGYTVWLRVDRRGSPPDTTFLEKIAASVEARRRAGHEVVVAGPREVALEIELSICYAPGYDPGLVVRRLRALFSAGTGPDGSPAFFHPDRWTFGQSLYLSAVLAAATAVPGVVSVAAKVFRRIDRPGMEALAKGVIQVQKDELVRLDNDVNAPGHGVCRIKVGGSHEVSA